ncbi:hypothetical protein [Paenibacillus sp. Soil522]|uniref:hypothetical protein n=1 Tax=Paenibacillus sp. Soil522 TaxID=1736388 RepID=UPI0006F689E8|nr:hypothetical protein [Paenibacillus sp. Soil522]KRE35618.1 hypothetical protein ASG81_20450 [Paenibacillus sp. Soil522]
MKHLKFLLFFVVVLTGLSSITEEALASTYPSAVAWNNFLYGVSVEEVDTKDIGNEIGKIERLRDPMPKKNGESNDIRTPVGSLLFEINGADTQDVIAVKVEDKFFKASKFGSIQLTTLDRIKEQLWVVTLSVCLLVLLTLIFVRRRKRRHIG